jgi:hypothetical protein
MTTTTTNDNDNDNDDDDDGDEGEIVLTARKLADAGGVLVLEGEEDEDRSVSLFFGGAVCVFWGGGRKEGFWLFVGLVGCVVGERWWLAGGWMGGWVGGNHPAPPQSMPTPHTLHPLPPLSPSQPHFPPPFPPPSPPVPPENNKLTNKHTNTQTHKHTNKQTQGRALLPPAPPLSRWEPPSGGAGAALRDAPPQEGGGVRRHGGGGGGRAGEEDVWAFYMWDEGMCTPTHTLRLTNLNTTHKS